ncbi:CHAT domain-containing protein [Actinomadura rubrisoli]|uniref:CHAT domain-containing protein n=1 Tax=Actinomadura rubrisoli TaxID=2530368 RepID=A0A4R5B4Q1_9ACTN|nr:CHAT domain-containing protein [Actinomadura rubrisoli]TDD79530.1 CHAT domain-containing protein [Actinomadura rubrisoli]
MRRGPDTAGEDEDDLLPLALSRPREALVRARRVLAGSPEPFAASVAHQAAGIVLREFGDSGEAVAELRAALRLARRSGSAEREADVLATLGVALVFAGRTTAGRKSLDAAAARSTGRLHGRILLRRGGVLLILGRHGEALADLNGAIATLRQAGDLMWEARGLTERASCHLALGRVRRAADDYRRAEELFARTGQELESVDATVHRGVLALRIGALPTALTCFDAAADRFGKLGADDVSLSVERCAALLAAGLSRDALAEAESALVRLERMGGRPAKRAELLLTAADCALAAGRPGPALESAAEAARLFGRQQRRWWRAHARLVRIRARFSAGPVTGALLGDAERCVAELAALGSPDLPLGRLVAGRIALALGRADAEGHLAAAARGRRHGPALTRSVGWLAEALRAEAAGDSRRLMHACRSGLAVIDDHRGTLGSSELRAQTTAHGAELASLGLRHALRLGRPRMLLAWSERWRASTLAVPPVRPPDDERLQAELAALRAITGRLPRAQAQGRPTAPLRAEQVRLERAVRARALRVQGSDRIAPAGCDIPGLLDELGDDRLVELVDVDGELHVLVCGSGRVRRFPAGRTEDAARQVDIARFGLTRLAHGRSAVPPEVLLERLHILGGRLDALLLGDAGGHLGDGATIVVPPGRLHAVPWPLVPLLRDRVLSVAPSAASWLRARRAARATAGPRAEGGVVLVRGPGLESGGTEVERLAGRYAADGAGPTVLGWGTAAAARVLAAMDGARLAHVAAHGTFRADSPMFSSLRMDDGPLTVYDLERLRRPPRQIVLSSCDSGRTAPAGADELLGLAASLIQLGTAGIVASVVPVNDVAAVPLMLALHQELRRGAALPTALRDARRAASPAASAGSAVEPVEAATCLSFISLGAG